MSESKFKQLQEDVCFKEPEEEIEPDKICPTCIPDQNYIEPDWTTTTEPYFNRAQCEYQIKAVINIDADIYYDSNQNLLSTSTISGEVLAGASSNRRSFRRTIDSPYRPEVLLKSYIRPAVRRILRYFGKLDSDEIVCASYSPNAQEGQICESIFGLDYEKHVKLTDLVSGELIPSTHETQEVDVENMQKEFAKITNPSALELFARVKDYTFITSANILTVHVSVPAHKFNQIPNKPDLGSLDTSTDKIIIRPPDFMDAIQRFQSAMRTFKGFQSYFYHEENGSIYFEETNEPFYIKFYADYRISNFVDSLHNLMERNRFHLKGFLNSGKKDKRLPEEIEITFNKDDEKNPFVVKNVRAKKRGCPYEECPEGLSTFIEYSKNDQTIMGYISAIDTIATELQSNKTPPWLDFVVSKTFPQLAVNYGSSNNLEDNACLSVNLQQSYDFILEQSMDLFTAIEYRFNQNQCKTKEEIIASREEVLDFFSGSPESEKALKDFGRAWKKRQEQVDLVVESAATIGKGTVKFFNNPVRGLSNMGKSIVSGALSAGEAIKQFVVNFNACDFSKSMTIALKCLAAGLTLDEVYYTILKQIISSSGEQALSIILDTLPANKRQQIEAEIEKQFKDMPYPWEPGWESGNLGKAVDREAIDTLFLKQEKQNLTSEEYESISSQLEKLETRRDLLNGVLLKLEGKPSDLITNILFSQDPPPGTEEVIQLIGKAGPVFQKVEEIREEITRINVNIQSDRNAILNFNSQLIDDTVSLSVADRNRVLENIQRFERLIARQLEEINIKNEQIELELSSIVEIVGELKKELKLIDKQVKKLQKQKNNKEKTLEDLEEYKNFSNLKPEEQQKLIDRQKKKTHLVKTRPSDQIQEGTLGKALGNVQAAVTQAYIEEIMKSATIVELQRAIENIPGANLLGKLITRFKCGTDPLIYPPIESFLSTLTFDPCGVEPARLSLPSIQEIPTNFDVMEQLSDAFQIGIRQVVSQVLIALIQKAAELIDTDLCRLAGNLTRGGLDGGLEGVLDNLLCPDLETNIPDDNVEDRQARQSKIRQRKNQEKNHQALLTAGGAGGRGRESNSALVRLLSVSATQKEIKQAMVGKADQNFLSNISSLVSATLPEFSSVFFNAQSTNQFFLQMGNILTPEQRTAVLNDLDNPLLNYPVETSICLTKEEKDEWDRQRQSAFSDPETGKEFVKKQDEKIKSDLADAANLLINGPNEALQNAISEAFNPKDPDCETNKGIIPGFKDYPQSRQQIISNAITGVFKTLERAFINDTIEDNFFGSFFNADTPGILIEILSNKQGINLSKHMLAKKNPFFRLLFVGFGELELPTTVGIQMKEYIEKTDVEYSIGTDYLINYDNEKSSVTLPGLSYNTNFTSVLRINDTYSLKGMISLTDEWSGVQLISDNFLEIPQEYHPNPDDVDREYPFCSMALGKLIEKQWEGFPIQLQRDDFNMFFLGMQNDILNKIPKRFLERQIGEISEGFLFGNNDTPILEDSDLVYVGPNGEEPYRDFYTEEQRVLGRSKTNNPRVHFLDPQKYGGTYRAPNIYIAEADHKGWMNFSKIIVPNPTGCDPKNSNFLMLDTLIEEIKKNKSKIQNHESLQYDPVCVSELPFDKVANSDTLATLEGIVRATIRVYLSDFLIRSFSIFSNVHLDTDRNYDNILLNYITETIYSGIINEKSLFASTYEGYTYALLFLEQVVQIVSRRVKSGDMETNQEIDDVLSLCNDLQENYPMITEKELSIMNTPEEIRDAIMRISPGFKEKIESLEADVKNGIAIIGSGGPDILTGLENLIFNFTGLLTIQQARFAAKINSIYSVELEIKKLLKYVIKEELDVYTQKMREEIEPRPWVYDINKFFIGGSKMMYGNQIEAGVYDAEIPIGGGVSSLPYGNINDCANRTMAHPLSNIEISDKRYEELKNRGGFYLEKYIVSDPKANIKNGLINIEPIGFSAGGRGLMSVQEFKLFLQQNSSIIPATANVSDYFGDASLNELGDGYDGSIGIKFGVRLCYMPPEGFEPQLSVNDKAREARSYILEPARFLTANGEKTLQSSKYTFPICSYEQDISDIKLIDLLNSNDNLNQDLKCYIDKLVKTKNYKHLLDNVLQIKKIPSIYMIYSYVNFIPSLGATSERTIDENFATVSQNSLAKAFNNSKSEARKLFASFYKNNDRDPPDESENNEDILQISQRKSMNFLSFIDLGEFSWDIRRRVRTDSPHDKDGNDCKNDFGKLFTIKEN